MGGAVGLSVPSSLLPSRDVVESLSTVIAGAVGVVVVGVVVMAGPLMSTLPPCSCRQLSRCDALLPCCCFTRTTTYVLRPLASVRGGLHRQSGWKTRCINIQQHSKTLGNRAQGSARYIVNTTCINLFSFFLSFFLSSFLYILYWDYWRYIFILRL